MENNKKVYDVSKYMVINTEHKPTAVLQINPGELGMVVGHSMEPTLHGTFGIGNAANGLEISKCDLIIVSEDPECFEQIAQALQSLADNLKRLKGLKGKAIIPMQKGGVILPNGKLS